MPLRLSSYSKDNFVAPFMSSFDRAEIPDLSNSFGQSSHWLSNSILNSLLGARFKDPLRQYLFNYLRRSEAAFRLHKLARDTTLEFLAGSRDSVSLYMLALFHWEVFLGQAWGAYNILIRAFELPRIFEKHDGSLEQRLNTLFNQSKHAESVIASGGSLDRATLAVWLANDGLHSHDTCITFLETGEILAEIGKWADRAQHPDSLVAGIRSEPA